MLVHPFNSGQESIHKCDNLSLFYFCHLKVFWKSLPVQFECRSCYIQYLMKQCFLQRLGLMLTLSKNKRYPFFEVVQSFLIPPFLLGDWPHLYTLSPFLEYYFQFQMYLIFESANAKAFMLNLCGVFGIYCKNDRHLWNLIMLSSTVISLVGINTC